MKVPICIGGAIAQRPGYGGHAWVFLQWLNSLAELGFEPYLIDRIPAESHEARRNRSGERSRSVAWLRSVMATAGLQDNFTLLIDGCEEVVGVPRARLMRVLEEAPCLLNFMGYVTDEELLAAASRRVFVDIDPGFGQMWQALGLYDPYGDHDDFVTVGENIGSDSCLIPTCGLDWIPTRQPIALRFWPFTPDSGSSFTSVGSWRGPYDPIEYDGRRYGLRAHSFRPIAALPSRCGAQFELALEIDSGDAADATMLESNGWHLLEPRKVAGNPSEYRSFIQGSKAELMVAKGMYVDTNSGWFSDRSICYLATGRPVLAQETGFGSNYPTGDGLLSFTDVDAAVEGVESIEASWQHHSRAAREIAEEYFDGRKVLGRLLDALGIA